MFSSVTRVGRHHFEDADDSHLVMARSGSEIGPGSNLNRTRAGRQVQVQVQLMPEPNAGFRFAVHSGIEYAERVRTPNANNFGNIRCFCCPLYV
jgi:hypothetical protein